MKSFSPIGNSCGVPAMQLALRGWGLWSWLPFVVIVAVAIVLGAPPDQPAKLFPDSVTYTSWGYGRPPTAFLFYAVAGSGRAACLVQTVLSIFSWSAFGWVALGLPGAAFGAALAVSMPIALWNYGILSESLTLSLGAALMAVTLALGRRWSRAHFALWTAVAILFTGVRVEDFVLVVPLAGALLLWHRARSAALVAAVVGPLAIFLYWGIIADAQNNHWRIRMTNIVLERVLGDPEVRERFYALGLPREESLKPYINQDLAWHDRTFRAVTPRFQQWLDTDSRRVYSSWLLTEMAHRKLVTGIDILLARPFFDYYVAGLSLAPLSVALNAFYDRVQLSFRHWLWLAAVPLICTAVTRSVRFTDLFALVFLVAVYGLAFVSYHGDASETPRHMMLVASLYRIAPLIALAGTWERAMSGHSVGLRALQHCLENASQPDAADDGGRCR